MQDWLTWSYWTDDWLGGFHFVCALGALVLGPIILLRRKGDQTHRWLGRIWAVMMAVIIVSAFSMYELDGGPNLFHFFALVSLITMSAGLWAIWQFKRTRKRGFVTIHQHFMVWAYFGLFMAGVWQITFSLVRSEVICLSTSWLYNGLSVFTVLSSALLFLILRKQRPYSKMPARH